MQYLLLIYDQEADFEKMAQSEQVAVYQEYRKLVDELKEKKISIGGPFAETKEQLGGYFLIEAKDLDEAIEVAARIPAAREGSIEVRPILPIGQAQSA